VLLQVELSFVVTITNFVVVVVVVINIIIIVIIFVKNLKVVSNSA
jgi:hypothetical protein